MCYHLLKALAVKTCLVRTEANSHSSELVSTHTHFFRREEYLWMQRGKNKPKLFPFSSSRFQKHFPCNYVSLYSPTPSPSHFLPSPNQCCNPASLMSIREARAIVWSSFQLGCLSIPSGRCDGSRLVLPATLPSQSPSQPPPPFNPRPPSSVAVWSTDSLGLEDGRNRVAWGSR